MVTVGMYYDVVSGKESVFESKFEEVVRVMDGQPGHVRSRLYRAVQQPRSYAIISEWASDDAFTTFIRSETFREVTSWGKAGILEGRPRHKVYGREGEIG